MADDELWDLTDADGRPLGRTHVRGSGPVPPGLFHVISGTCAQRADGRILLTFRAAEKEFPLSWEFPAGSALAGETSRDAAARELREETGIAVDAADLRLVGRFAEATALLDLYTVRVTDDVVLSLDPAEVVDAEWIAVDDLDARVPHMAAPWAPRLAALGDALRAALSS